MAQQGENSSDSGSDNTGKEDFDLSGDLYRALAESSPEMVYLLDMNGNVRYVNKTGMAMFAPHQDVVVGKNVRDLFPPAQAERHLAVVGRVVATGEMVSSEVESVFPSGKRWIDARLTPVRSKTGAIMGVLGLSQDITDRKMAEAALRQSQQKFMSLFRNMAEGVALHTVITDSAGTPVNYRIEEVNPQYEALLGLRREDIAGKLATEVYGTTPPYLEEFCGVGISGRPGRLETYFAPMDRHFDISIAPWGDRGFATIFTDVTAKKKREELLFVERDIGVALSAAKNIEEGLRICLNGALRISGMDAGGIYLINESGGLDLRYHTGLSEPFVRNVSCYPSQSKSASIIMAGKPVYTHYSTMAVPDFAEKQQEGLRAIAVIPFRHEGRINGCINIASHTRDELYEQSRLCLEIIANQIGGGIGWLQAQAALCKSEERYRQIVDHINDEMYIHDFNGTILDVNENACRSLGYSRAELLAMRVDSIDAPAEAHLVKQRMKNLIETGSLVFDGEHIRKDGTPVAVNVSARVVSTEKGGVVQSFVRDISALKKMESELGRREKLEALGLLAGGIAHDFNNLLSGMFGFMDLARMSLEPGTQAYDYLKQAHSGFERAKNLSHQLLTFSKGGSPQKRAVSIVDIVQESGTLALSGSNVRMVLDVKQAVPAVGADQHQLAQVFSNLFINARQAMPDGGTIRVRFENCDNPHSAGIPVPAGSYVVVQVHDEGIGIPEKIIDRIFDPFFTTKQQGSGLGLSICFSIIKKHGGHISVASKPGEGSTFTLWLPSTSQPVAEAEIKNNLQTLKGTGMVLVMDDEPTIREMASFMLSGAGYTVVTATDGAAAVEKFRQAQASGKPFNLVVLDLTVPGGMGGEKALGEIKKIDSKVVALVSSGYADGTQLVDYKRIGFAGIIPKPYTIHELLSHVKKALTDQGK